jgi:hypothetical protein
MSHHSKLSALLYRNLQASYRAVYVNLCGFIVSDNLHPLLPAEIKRNKNNKNKNVELTVLIFPSPIHKRKLLTISSAILKHARILRLGKTVIMKSVQNTEKDSNRRFKKIETAIKQLR